MKLSLHALPKYISQPAFNKRKNRTRCDVQKLTIKIPEQRITPCSSVSIVNFEHVMAGWVIY